MDRQLVAALTRAMDWIREGKTQEARTLLSQLVMRYPQSAEAWWLLTFVLDDPDAQVYALRRVLHLDPRHAQAQARLTELTGPAGAFTGRETETPPRPAVAPPPGVPGTDDAQDRASAASEKPARGAPLRLAGIALAVLVLGAAGVYAANQWLLNRANPAPAPATAGVPAGTPTPTFTRVPSAPTTTPTASQTPTPAPPYVARFEPGACPFAKPEKATVECGFLAVPENRDRNLADVVRLAVAVYRSSRDRRSQEAVVFLQGGPGMAALEPTAGTYDTFIAPLLKGRDMIVFDQRGTGLSRPRLQCTNLIAIYLEDHGEPLPAATREAAYADALETCRDSLTAAGADLGTYTTATSAADLNDLIGALGYQSVDLYGVSYGTRLAQVMMRDYPQRIRSVVLDSVVPLGGVRYGSIPEEQGQALDRLFALCAADPACQAAYPDPPAVYAEQVARLDTAPVTLTATLQGRSYTTTAGGAALTNGVLWMLRWPQLIPLIPQTLYQLRDGDTMDLAYALSLPASILANTSLPVLLSTGCHELIYAATPEQLDAYLAARPSTEAAGLPALFGSGAALYRVCRSWGAPALDPAEQTPVASDIPTLLLAGELDPSTPPAFAEKVRAGLAHSYFFTIPAHGHAPTLAAASRCPLTIAADFLSRPAAEPGRTCLAAIETVRFVVPYDGTQPIPLEDFTYPTFAVTGKRPSGWTPAENGFYTRSASTLDSAQIGIQSSTQLSVTGWLDWLRSEYERLDGNGVAVTAAGTRSAGNLNWQLYTATVLGHEVTLALAQDGDRALLVILSSDRAEHDALVRAVFLPVVDSVQVIR